TVFLERNTQHQYACLVDGDILFGHQLDHAVGDIDAHVVVDLAAGEDHLGVIAKAFSLVREVIRVNADAVAADKSGLEGQKIPLGTGRFEDFIGVNADALKDQSQFV